MSNSQFQDKAAQQGEAVNEQDLSPEAQQVLAGARRSFGFSMLILLLGFVAVVGALVYRAYRSGEERVNFATNVAVPAGAQVISSAADGSRLLITYELDGQTTILWADSITGETLGETVLSAD